MDENQVIVDAGDALTGGGEVETTTTTKENEETLNNLKTVQTQEEPKPEEPQKSEDGEGNEGEEQEKKTFDAPKQEEDDESEDEPKSEDEPEKEDEEEEDDEDDSASDITYIKNNPEAILELIKDLQKSNFQDKWKKKFELELAEKEELEAKYKELQKQKYADKYDDANLPVLEEKRPFWRAQNKFYQDPENSANRQAYIRRLEEEIEDIRLEEKTVSIDNKETTNPEPKVTDEYKSLGRVGVQVSKPRR